MYLVFIAMLALNVSAEVLDGFDLVEESLVNSSQNMQKRNLLTMNELESYWRQNPDKAGEWHDKGLQVKTMSDSLNDYIETLKLKMVQKADGKDADLGNLKHREDLDAASTIMLSPIDSQGKKLKTFIDNYRETVTQLVSDNRRREIIANNLSTQPSKKAKKMNKNWEESLFEQMPVAAAITILTKMQNDVRSSEGEALSSLLSSVDAGDFKINDVRAYVIPESDVVVKGGTYNARIVLSAEDSTQYPKIVVNGSALAENNRGQFSARTASAGVFPVEGYIEMTEKDGSVIRRNFKQNYTVIEPTASIAPTLMNVLYAGIENEISISVPGFAPQDVNAAMTNGTLSRKGNLWYARPAAGRESEISITTKSGNQMQQLASKKFRVRPLPDPAPYIEYTDANGNLKMFKGGNLSKSVLLNSEGIKAAIDDGILNIPFQVKSFRTVFFDSMGNAIPEISDGSRFSNRQKEQIRRLTRGKYFYISGVKASGPDGSEREIAVVEVRVN